MSARWRLTAMILLLSYAAPHGVRAQVADAKSTEIAPADVAVPSAPRAVQIEPMVAPVKRSAPQTPGNKAKSAIDKSASVAGAATSGKGLKGQDAVRRELESASSNSSDNDQKIQKSLTKKIARKSR